MHSEGKVIQIANVTYDPESESLTGNEVLLNERALRAYNIALDANLPSRSNGISNFDVKQVHFYVTDYNKSDDGQIEFNKANLTDTKLLQVATAANGLVLVGVALVVTAIGIAALAAILYFACNCPHVYVNNGKEYVRTSNAFVGSVSKTLEQPDFALVPLKNASLLKVEIINEEEQEEQYINEVKLLEIVHDSQIDVIPDQSGNIFGIVDPLKPRNNEDVLVADDGLSYDFVETESENGLYELTLDFDHVSAADEAKLVLALKNTYWASYVMKEWYGLFGSEIKDIKERNAKRTAEAQLNWQKEQGITLSVFIKKEGRWVFQDDVNVVGNTIYRDLVVPIDLSGVEGETASVKLVAGFKLWEIDYAGLDYSENSTLEVTELSPSEVLKNSQAQSSDQISMDDKSYQQLTKNDTLSLSFISTQVDQDKAVSYVLKTKGYYIKNLDQTGAMAKRELMSFRRKGQMSRYSRYLMENTFSEMSLQD